MVFEDLIDAGRHNASYITKLKQVIEELEESVKILTQRNEELYERIDDLELALSESRDDLERACIF